MRTSIIFFPRIAMTCFLADLSPHVHSSVQPQPALPHRICLRLDLGLTDISFLFFLLLVKEVALLFLAASSLCRKKEKRPPSDHDSSSQTLSQPPTQSPRQNRGKAHPPSQQHPDREAYAARPPTMVGIEEFYDQQPDPLAASLCALEHRERS